MANYLLQRYLLPFQQQSGFLNRVFSTVSLHGKDKMYLLIFISNYWCLCLPRGTAMSYHILHDDFKMLVSIQSFQIANPVVER